VTPASGLADQNQINEAEIADNEKNKDVKPSNHDIEFDKMRASMWHTRLFVNRPCTIIGVYSLILVVFVVITITGKFYEMNDQADREYLVWDNERTIKQD